jgi:serine/threonine-protein kinase RsbW
MINKSILQKEFIARLTIQSDKNFIPQAQAFTVFYARLFNFSDSELQKIELITEEAILNTIQNTFGEEEIGTIDVKIIYQPGKFIISIEDQGIPVDFRVLEKSEHSGLGILLMKNLADEFHFVNLGRNGKRLELVKYLPEESIPEMISGAEQEALATSQEIQESDVPVIRLISPDDAEMLSRLVYRVYGYSYLSVFYFPDKIRELIANGLLVSAVAVNAKQEIVGNLSLLFEHAGSKVADSGAAMVDPRYRGHNLFKSMKSFLRKYGAEKGMYGLYSEAVTIHTFSQQGNMSLGAKETGIMLAYLEEKWTFKKINNDQLAGQRQACVLYFLKTSQEPQRTVYICERFYPVLKKIYDNLEMQREVVMTDTTAAISFSESNSQISSIFKPDLNVAVISVSAIGEDAFALIGQQLQEFCLNKVDSIYVEMPVDTPVSAVLSTRLTGLGFTLSGIVPEYRNGDYLKMQYLNNVKVDVAKIHIASDLGKELLAEITKNNPSN